MVKRSPQMEPSVRDALPCTGLKSNNTTPTNFIEKVSFDIVPYYTIQNYTCNNSGVTQCQLKQSISTARSGSILKRSMSTPSVSSRITSSSTVKPPAVVAGRPMSHEEAILRSVTNLLLASVISRRRLRSSEVNTRSAMPQSGIKTRSGSSLKGSMSTASVSSRITSSSTVKPRKPPPPAVVAGRPMSHEEAMPRSVVKPLLTSAVSRRRLKSSEVNTRSAMPSVDDKTCWASISTARSASILKRSMPTVSVCNRITSSSTVKPRKPPPAVVASRPMSHVEATRRHVSIATKPPLMSATSTRVKSSGVAKTYRATHEIVVGDAYPDDIAKCLVSPPVCIQPSKESHTEEDKITANKVKKIYSTQYIIQTSLKTTKSKLKSRKRIHDMQVVKQADKIHRVDHTLAAGPSYFPASKKNRRLNETQNGTSLGAHAITHGANRVANENNAMCTGKTGITSYDYLHLHPMKPHCESYYSSGPKVLISYIHSFHEQSNETECVPFDGQNTDRNRQRYKVETSIELQPIDVQSDCETENKSSATQLNIGDHSKTLFSPVGEVEVDQNKPQDELKGDGERGSLNARGQYIAMLHGCPKKSCDLASHLTVSAGSLFDPRRTSHVDGSDTDRKDLHEAVLDDPQRKIWQQDEGDHRGLSPAAAADEAFRQRLSRAPYGDSQDRTKSHTDAGDHRHSDQNDVGNVALERSSAHKHEQSQNSAGKFLSVGSRHANNPGLRRKSRKLNKERKQTSGVAANDWKLETHVDDGTATADVGTWRLPSCENVSGGAVVSQGNEMNTQIHKASSNRDKRMPAAEDTATVKDSRVEAEPRLYDRFSSCWNSSDIDDEPANHRRSLKFKRKSKDILSHRYDKYQENINDSYTPKQVVELNTGTESADGDRKTVTFSSISNPSDILTTGEGECNCMSIYRMEFADPIAVRQECPNSGTSFKWRHGQWYSKD